MMLKRKIDRYKFILFENALCMLAGLIATMSIGYILILQFTEHIIELFCCVFYLVGISLYFVIWIVKVGLRTTQKATAQRIEAGIAIGLSVCCVTLVCQGKVIWDCAKEYPGHEYQKEAVILVLGGELKDNRPTPILQQRLDVALECYKVNPQAVFLCSGGPGSEPDSIAEAIAMRDYLIENGVDEGIIYCETKSASTYENFAYSSLYVVSETNVIIVTSDFHAYRAGLMADAVGMEYSEIWMSQTESPVFFYYFVREILGCLAWKVGVY